MNWFFLRPPAPSETCDRVQPLLSLLADGMASPAEIRCARTHLDTCLDCRQAFAWMQATHDVLATRERVAIPADLHARCRRAWAAEEALAPLPRRAAPPRSRLLRPAFATALSVVAVGVVLGHYLAPAPPVSVQPIPAPVHPAKPSGPVAVLPPAADTRPAAGHTHPGPQAVALKPLGKHATITPLKRAKDAFQTDEIALLPPAPAKAVMFHVKRDTPAQIANNSVPTPAKHAVTNPNKFIAKQTKTHPEMMPPVSHDDPSAQMATNKTDASSTAVHSDASVPVPTSQDVPPLHTASYAPTPHHSDPLGAVRMHVVSLSEEGGEHKIAMAAGGIHPIQSSFVQTPFVYTH